MAVSAPSSIRQPSASPAALRERVIAALELLLVISVLEVGMWELCGPLHDTFRWLALPLVGAIVWNSHRRRTVVIVEHQSISPTSRDTLVQAWWKALSITAALALLIPALAWLARGEGEGFRLFWLEKGPLKLLGYLAGKLGFIVVQQVLLQYFLATCCWELTRHRRFARVAAAILFGLMHLPSLLLVGITTLAGYCWLNLFARGGRIAPLAASHLALALLAHAALPERLTLNMRVGAPAMEIAGFYDVLDDPLLGPHARALCSERYYAQCGHNDADFVQSLYRDVLGRSQPVTADEAAFWERNLAIHARADVVVEFFACAEFRKLKQAGETPRVADRLALRLAEIHNASDSHNQWR